MADPRILRLIQKWLKAGVMGDGKWMEAKTGSPQGSVISSLLANIYLHYTFDLWVNVWRREYAQGEVVIIRFADDTMAGFQYQTDADHFLREHGKVTLATCVDALARPNAADAAFVDPRTGGHPQFNASRPLCVLGHCRGHPSIATGASGR